MGIKLYNTSPIGIKRIDIFKDFMNKLESFLLKNSLFFTSVF